MFGIRPDRIGANGRDLSPYHVPAPSLVLLPVTRRRLGRRRGLRQTEMQHRPLASP